MESKAESEGWIPLLYLSSRLQRKGVPGSARPEIDGRPAGASMLGIAVAAGVFAFCITAAGLGATLPGQMPGPGDKSQPSSGPLLLTLEGRGVQVYRCNAATTEAPGWVLDHPEADLLDRRHKVVGHHDAGPSWHLEDGSTVKGEVIQKTEPAEPRAIPWLLLRVTVHQGTGLLAGVETIRRTQTHGGVAPAQGCDSSMVGATVRVPYTAIYTFYGKP